MATVAYALTTVQRVKDRLGITTSGFDTLFERLVNATTDFIESQCSRRFKETSYTNEICLVECEGARMLMLKQAPITALSSFQYRAGVPTNPSWTNFLPVEYEIVGDGSSGLIRIYGGIPRGTNNIQASYVAGYKIDFEHETDATKHTLPFDLTDLCERFIVKAFKKRESMGKLREAAAEAMVIWFEKIEPEDQLTLDRYTRVYL